MSENSVKPKLCVDTTHELAHIPPAKHITGVEYILSIQAAKRDGASKLDAVLTPEATREQIMEVAYGEFGHGGI